MTVSSPYMKHDFYKNNNNHFLNYNAWNSPLHNPSEKIIPHTNYQKSNKENFTFKKHSSDTYKSTHSDYIDLLGMRLFFDDVLLILLIYFLYTEGVTDIYLFLILILLLLD